MKLATVRALCRLALLVLLLVSLCPSASRAEDSVAPPPPTTALPDERSSDAEIVEPDALPRAATLSATAGTPVTAAGHVSSLGIQGVVTLDVSVADTAKPGDEIIYTYRYHNTGGATATGVVLDALWASYSATLSSGAWQYCDPSPCDVMVGSVQSSTVTKDSTGISSGVRFRIADLAPGQAGQFSVRLRSNKAFYPKSNQPVIRPSGSGKLYLNNNTGSVISEDTTNTMVIGPVLAVWKAAPAGLKIYPTQTARFVITVGNAAGSGDIINGTIRPDARPATGVVVRDVFPAGSEFVSATGDYSVNTTAKTITWNITGTLNPGQTVQFEVEFRKLNVAIDCARLNNAIFNVTSNEMPIVGTSQAVVAGAAAALPVVVPVLIKSVTANPVNVAYGAESTITITAQNFWPQPINGMQLAYTIQSNAYYIPGSASPAAKSAPDGTQLGGVVSWAFNIGAGSMTAPTQSSFTLRVRAGTTSSSTGGVAQVLVPAEVPAACITTRAGKVGVNAPPPSLKLKKITDADPSTVLNGTYIVERGQDFSYIIELTNTGSTDATGVDIVDALPKEVGANFNYVVGSAALDGQPFDPTSWVDGQAGNIIWNGVTVPSGGTVRLRYTLRVDGRDYQKYCNSAEATSGSDTVTYGSRTVCVKINPQIEITKTVDRTTAKPGEEVRFTLTLTNHEPIAYSVGLYDKLGSFSFVRQESGYAQPQALAGALEWPRVWLSPGQQVSAVIIAQLPATCVTKTYNNEALFHNETDLIQRVPAMVASVRATCVTPGQIDYSQAVDRTTVSLRDKHVYTLTLVNTDANTATNVVVENVLPQGFKYLGLDTASTVKTAPQQQTNNDGRTELSWTIPSIASKATVRVKYIAQSGEVVGSYSNLFTVATGGRCTAGCTTYQGAAYASRAVDVQPLITMEPQLTPATCALPGNTRGYKLTIVNTNNHDYNNTQVAIELPLGLRFIRTLNATPAAGVSSLESGASTVYWNNLRVPAKPASSFASVVVLEVELQVGQVWGNLDTTVRTDSLDGAIPRKDGVEDPTVRVCPPQSSVSKEVNKSMVLMGKEVLYQITLANTTGTAINATIQDQLPAGTSFSGMVSGSAPRVSGTTLTWDNLIVPPGTSNQPGLTILQFRARIVAGSVGTSYQNTARVVSSSVPLDTTYDTASVMRVWGLYLPAVQR